MSLRRVLYGLCFAVLGVALLPLISVLFAGSVAAVAGCDLNEGSINPCILFGHDWGGTLYTLAMVGWLGLVTMPFAAVALLLILLLALFDLIRYLRG